MKKGLKKQQQKNNGQDQFNKKKSLSIFRLKNNNSCRQYNQDKNYLIQTDTQFLDDVRKISKANSGILGTFLQNLKDKKSNQLTNEQCDIIDYNSRLHYKANKINTNSDLTYKQIDPNDRCKCGCRKGRGKSLNLCTSQQQLNILGSGVILYLAFNKMLTGILFLMVLIFGIYALTINLTGHQSYTSQCKNVYCKFIIEASSENRQLQFSIFDIQFWIGMSFCLLWIICLRLIKYIGRNKDQKIDQLLNSASDYAAFIQNLPYGQYQQTQLIAYFDLLYDKRVGIKKNQDKKNNGSNSNKINNYRINYDDSNRSNKFNMKKIQIIYDMQFSRKMLQKISGSAVVINNLLSADYNNCIHKNDFKKYLNYKLQICKTLDLFLDIRKKFLYDQYFRKQLSSTVALVQFNTPQDKDTFLNLYGCKKMGILKRLQQTVKSYIWPKDHIMFRGQILSVQRAPQPSDILFQNCEKKFSLKRILGIYSITFLIIIISFGIISLISFLQQKFDRQHKQKASDAVLTIINLSIAASLQIINKILWIALSITLKIQYNHTNTQRIISQMNKGLVATCLNIIFLPILSNVILKDNYYGYTGLAGIVFDYHISLIYGLALKLVEPINLVKRILFNIKKIRNFIIRYYCKTLKNLTPQQPVKQINALYQGNDFDVAQNYINLMCAIYHAIFFCHLQPFILFLVTIYVFCFYWVNKVNILKVCKIPEMTQFLVFQTAISLASLVPVIYGVGSIVIQYLQNGYGREHSLNYIQVFISIGIGLFGFFNPGDYLNKIVKYIISFGKQKFQMFKQIIQDQSKKVSAQINQKNIDDKIQKKIKKNQMNRQDSYYKNSNSLTLFGFQYYLEGLNNKYPIHEQLEKFCAQFFPQIIKSSSKLTTEDQELDTQEQQKIRSLEIAKQLLAKNLSKVNQQKSHFKNNEIKKSSNLIQDLDQNQLSQSNLIDSRKKIIKKLNKNKQKSEKMSEQNFK